ncbi:MAG: DnaD domain protein [Clostridia bacterium]|nr:DnaD domain protein [Clostridia bacterium]
MGLFSFSDKFANFGATAVDNQFLVEYMPSATGDEVKVYLYGLFACASQMPDVSLAQIAHDLALTESDVKKAYRHWERVGLVERTGDNPLSYRYLPVNQAVFTGTAMPVDDGYERFTEAVYAVFGNDTRIHGQQLVKYYEWVVELGLPQEVVLMLIRHMISVKGKNFSTKAAEKLAVELARENVRTIEDAEQALSHNVLVLECSRAVLRRLNMRREPTEPEMEMCSGWLKELGYTQAAILAACDDTTAAGNPSFKYLDSILRKKHSKGEDTVSQKQYEEKRRADEQRREPLRRVYEALGRGANAINEGTLSVYWSLRETLDNEAVIQYAAEQVGRANGKLEDVVNMVSSWAKRGIRDEAGAKAYVEAFSSERTLLVSLGDTWGIRPPSGEANHKLVKKWRGAGMPDDVIVHVAGTMRVDARHMPYLDAILTRLISQGALTMEAADKALSEHREAPTSAPQTGTRGGKQVTENNYEQRENTERGGDDVPAWVLERRKEMAEHAQGNPGPAQE